MIGIAPVAIVGSINPSSSPSIQDIMRLPLAEAGRYAMKRHEIETLRARIYSLNKSHVKGWRWRTTCIPTGRRNEFNLIVWRVK